MDFILVFLDVSTHSRLKAAGSVVSMKTYDIKVSTHSRLKAAGSRAYHRQSVLLCFNTQPPEGGWMH